MTRRAECFGCGEFLKVGTACRSCKPMTTKPNSGTVSVSRELLEELRNVCGDPSLWQQATEALVQTAEQQGEPFAFISKVTLAVAEDIREYQFGVGRIGARLDRNERHCIPLYLHAQPATAKADEQAEALKKAKANTDYDEFDNGVD